MFDWEHADVARHEGDDTIIVAGSFGFDISDAELLLDALPRFLLIPGQHPSAAVIRTTLQIITPEIMGPQIGAAILTDRLVDVLLILVVRAALDQYRSKDFGWIGALTDPRIGNWRIIRSSIAVEARFAARMRRHRCLQAHSLRGLPGKPLR